MPNWKLTDEEIQRAISAAYLYGSEYGRKNYYAAIALAAQKRLVEWLCTRWRGYEENKLAGTYRTTFALSDKEWQALCKELGVK